MNNLPPELLGITDDTERFKVDIALRPEEMSVKSTVYKEIPIEDFGAAMLRGMGWEGYTDKDEEIAKKNQEPLFARDVHLGLGAKAKPLQLDDKNKFRNNSTKLEQSKAEWLIKAETKLNSQKIQEGDIVWLRAVEYAGLRAVVLKTQGVPGLNKISVKLETSSNEIYIKKSDVIVLTKDELEEKPFKYSPSNIESVTTKEQNSMEYFGLKNKDVKTAMIDETKTKSNTDNIRNNEKKYTNVDNYHKLEKVSSDKLSSSRNNDDKNVKNDSYLDKYKSNTINGCGAQSQVTKSLHDKYGVTSSSASGAGSSSYASHSKCWLQTGLRVKLISNKYPKYYLKKGVILDVHGDNLASIRFEGSNNQNRDTMVVDNIRQKYLETVVPSKNEHCIILNHSNYKGFEAIVVEKNVKSSSSNDSNVIIQLADELNIILEVSMDDICAFQEDIYHNR